MHAIQVDPAILERNRRQRGREHIFEAVSLPRTAHIIIDLQNGFMVPGATVEVATAREIVRNVNSISSAVRGAGGVNIFLRYVYDPDESEPWSSRYEKLLTRDRAKELGEAFAPRSIGAALWSELSVQAGDLVLDKSRFSGFVQGTCNLHRILQERGIENLIITGTVSNCCCESTARDGAQLNYNVIFVSDGNAARTDREHNSALNNIAAFFGDVLSTEEVLALVEASRDCGNEERSPVLEAQSTLTSQNQKMPED